MRDRGCGYFYDDFNVTDGANVLIKAMRTHDSDMARRVSDQGCLCVGASLYTYLRVGVELCGLACFVRNLVRVGVGVGGGRGHVCVWVGVFGVLLCVVANHSALCKYFGAKLQPTDPSQL